MAGVRDSGVPDRSKLGVERALSNGDGAFGVRRTRVKGFTFGGLAVVVVFLGALDECEGAGAILIAGKVVIPGRAQIRFAKP